MALLISSHLWPLFSSRSFFMRLSQRFLFILHSPLKLTWRMPNFLNPTLKMLLCATIKQYLMQAVCLGFGPSKNTNVQQKRQELSWSVPTLSHLDPRTAQSEIEVRRILDLQNVAESMPDAFSVKSISSTFWLKLVRRYLVL